VTSFEEIRERPGCRTAEQNQANQVFPSSAVPDRFLQGPQDPRDLGTLVGTMPRILIAEDRDSMRHTLRQQVGSVRRSDEKLHRHQLFVRNRDDCLLLLPVESYLCAEAHRV